MNSVYATVLKSFRRISLFVTNDAIAKHYCDVKFSQIEGNSRKFSHIEQQAIASSVKYSNSERAIQHTLYYSTSSTVHIIIEENLD